MSLLDASYRPQMQPFYVEHARHQVECPPDTMTLRKRVEATVLRGTAREAVRNTDPGRSDLSTLWASAAQGAVAWHDLPTRAFEALESPGATASDLDFIAQTRDRPVPEAVAGVRLLGSIGQDALAPADRVRALLLDFIEHPSAAVRIAVVEAVWQAADRDARPALAAALAKESHPKVARTLEHVLHLLG